MTPERRAALERCRGKTYLDLNFDDLWFVSEIALDDYPADDKCEMSRQELIAEVERLKRLVSELERSDRQDLHPLWEP